MKWNNIKTTTPQPGTLCLIRDPGAKTYRCALFSASSDWVVDNSRFNLGLYEEWLPFKEVERAILEASDRVTVVIDSVTRDIETFRFVGTRCDTCEVINFIFEQTDDQREVMLMLSETPLSRISFELDGVECKTEDGVCIYAATNLRVEK